MDKMNNYYKQPIYKADFLWLQNATEQEVASFVVGSGIKGILDINNHFEITATISEFTINNGGGYTKQTGIRLETLDLTSIDITSIPLSDGTSPPLSITTIGNYKGISVYAKPNYIDTEIIVDGHGASGFKKSLTSVEYYCIISSEVVDIDAISFPSKHDDYLLLCDLVAIRDLDDVVKFIIPELTPGPSDENEAYGLLYKRRDSFINTYYDEHWHVYYSIPEFLEGEIMWDMWHPTTWHNGMYPSDSETVKEAVKNIVNDLAQGITAGSTTYYADNLISSSAVVDTDFFSSPDGSSLKSALDDIRLYSLSKKSTAVNMIPSTNNFIFRVEFNRSILSNTYLRYTNWNGIVEGDVTTLSLYDMIYYKDSNILYRGISSELPVIRYYRYKLIKDLTVNVVSSSAFAYSLCTIEYANLTQIKMSGYTRHNEGFFFYRYDIMEHKETAVDIYKVVYSAYMSVPTTPSRTIKKVERIAGSPLINHTVSDANDSMYGYYVDTVGGELRVHTVGASDYYLTSTYPYDNSSSKHNMISKGFQFNNVGESIYFIGVVDETSISSSAITGKLNLHPSLQGWDSVFYVDVDGFTFLGKEIRTNKNIHFYDDINTTELKQIRPDSSTLVRKGSYIVSSVASFDTIATAIYMIKSLRFLISLPFMIKEDAPFELEILSIQDMGEGDSTYGSGVIFHSPAYNVITSKWKLNGPASSFTSYTNTIIAQLDIGLSTLNTTTKGTLAVMFKVTIG